MSLTTFRHLLLTSCQVYLQEALLKSVTGGHLCRIVLAQLEGSGRGSLASYNAEAYDALTTMLQDEPMRDGDAWLEKLLTRNEMLGASA